MKTFQQLADDLTAAGFRPFDLFGGIAVEVHIDGTYSGFLCMTETNETADAFELGVHPADGDQQGGADVHEDRLPGILRLLAAVPARNSEEWAETATHVLYAFTTEQLETAP